MENGTYHYDLEMHTPLGNRHGSLELIVWKNFLNGCLTMFTRTIPIRDGRCDGNTISFHGDMKTLMKMLPYQAEGSVSSNHVKLTIKTDQGSYNATGVLTQARRDLTNV